MVVAAGAGDRQPQQAAGERVDAVVDLVELLAVAVVHRPGGEEAQRRQIARSLSPPSIRSAAICCPDELVVRHVGVERVDDPVAVAEALRIEPGFERVGLVLAVAGHVEPVPGPPLAVVRRGEQAVDHTGERLGRLVGQERLDLVGRRRQAGQVERRAADQRALVGGLRRREAGVFQSARTKRSIGCARPGCVVACLARGGSAIG